MTTDAEHPTLSGDGPFVATNATRVDVYHTDPDCGRLHRGRNPREVSATLVEWHELEECVACRGEMPVNKTHSGPAVGDRDE